jgi:hypothetical protein
MVARLYANELSGYAFDPTRGLIVLLHGLARKHDADKVRKPVECWCERVPAERSE